jgi:hypothetical protein
MRRGVMRAGVMIRMGIMIITKIEVWKWVVIELRVIIGFRIELPL